MNYIETLKQARKENCAIGAFNIFNVQSILGAVDAASEADSDVILQTSTKTVKFYGAQTLANLVRACAYGRKGHVFLHLDHCRDVALAKECVDAGWDSVMFDGSALPVDENIALCVEVARYAHKAGVVVEGELGRIAGVEEDVAAKDSDVSRISLDDCLKFVERSEIDAFAPGIGTAHGVYKGVPKIDFELVETLREHTDVPVVIHGGTGLSDDAFRRLIFGGGCKVNVSTALKAAYYDSIRGFLAAQPHATEPLDLDAAAREGIKKVVFEHIKRFGGELK
ncbi:MAG: class II fructose-bisphosphate aldolase [Oscillospiraceae bacterium]